MLALKYTNSKLFSPVPLKLTQIIKAEKPNERVQNPNQRENDHKIQYNKRNTQKLYNNKWPKNSNIRFIGLNNLGNTCYLNSMFQSILNIPQLYDGVNNIQEDTKLTYESRYGKNVNSILMEKGKV